MKRIVLLVLVASFAWVARAQWGGPQSRVVTDTIYSEILKADRAYSIYLPKSYELDKDRKYPILYLLHGVMGTNVGWFPRPARQGCGRPADGFGRGVRDDYRQPQCGWQSL